MYYMFLFLYALLKTILCCIYYVIVFILGFLWNFKITKYSEVITNNGYKIVYVGEDAVSFKKRIPLEYDSNPIDTFKKVFRK